MLSAEEQVAFARSSGNVRVVVLRQLRRARDASSAIGFVSNLHRAVDKVVEEVDGRGPAMDCRAGCSHCCSVRVEASAAEVFRIAGELKRRPAREIEALVERLGRRVAAGANDGPPSGRTPCGFLDNHLCSIYDIRPAVCRKAHSLSVQHCRDHAPQIPQNLEMHVAAHALIEGASGAYHEAALSASPQELCGAVLRALRDDTLQARWFGGESVFPD